MRIITPRYRPRQFPPAVCPILACGTVSHYVEFTGKRHANKAKAEDERVAYTDKWAGSCHTFMLNKTVGHTSKQVIDYEFEWRRDRRVLE